MNWRVVAEKNINALSELRRWVYHAYGSFSLMVNDGDILSFRSMDSQKNYTLDNRALYDFFDEKEIIIEIGVDWTKDPKFCYRVARFIPYDKPNWHWSDLYYKRTEAEEQAFERAFQLLEEKLKREGK